MSKEVAVSVLFVCMGNICRSPTAQGVFEYLVNTEDLAGHIHIDSAGTHAYHIGESPDRRAMEAALRRGVDLSTQRARRVAEIDFQRFDLVLAMDRDNYNDLLAVCPNEQSQKLRLFLDFAPQTDTSEVPDPYYGGGDGFERVLDLVEQAARGLLTELRQQYQL